MTKGLPSKVKSHICLHFTIPSSPPSHCTYLPSPSCLYFRAGRAGKETQPKPLPLAGSLRDGEENKSILPYLLKSINTFEIKLPPVQIITCNVGMLFWVWLISSQWKGFCPLLSPAKFTAITSLAPSLCALCPADSQEMLQGRTCGRPWTCQAVLFVFKGMLGLSSLPFS